MCGDLRVCLTERQETAHEQLETGVEGVWAPGAARVYGMPAARVYGMPAAYAPNG